MKIIKSIKNILINVLIFILIIITIIAIYSFVQLNILKKDFCNIFGYTFFQVETASMSGTIEIEDIIIVKLGSEEIKENDIITFRKDNNFITHRVLKIEDEIITAKGDRNNTEDEPVKKEDVIGKVTFIINDVKVWKSVFTDAKVLISMGITLFLLILLVSYKEKVGEKNV